MGSKSLCESCTRYNVSCPLDLSTEEYENTFECVEYVSEVADAEG